MTDLRELLTRDRVLVGSTAADWKDAIRLAGSILEDDGLITGDYTQSMIDTVVDKGPYIVLAPGFAFAHARPSDSVSATGLSWVKLAQPVVFGHPNNDPVTHVVALAATDPKAHLQAMKQLAKLLADPARWADINGAASRDELYDSVMASIELSNNDSSASGAAAITHSAQTYGPGAHATKDHILTVCGNGLGTSLFLKNTLEKVLDTWGWGSLISVEATDTISAKGKAKDADCILTSGEIARTLGDVGVPVEVISNFTSTAEIDAALRRLYDLDGTGN